MKYLLYNIPSIICFSTAFWLLYNQIEGWGWFLFVGVIVMVSVQEHLGNKNK